MNAEVRSEVPDALDPESPLMTRFQNALKGVLRKQINELDDAIQGLECNIKSLKREKEDAGEQIYKEKSELEKQQDLVASYRKSLSSLADLKCKIDSHRDVMHTNYKEELTAINDLEKQNSILKERTEFSNAVYWKLEDRVLKNESDLLVMKQSINHKKRMKTLCLDEKLQQDIILMRIENEVMKMERLLSNLESKLCSEEEKLNHLMKTNSEENTDIRFMLCDNERLFGLWQGVLTLISKRDADYVNVKEKLNSAENNLCGFRLESKQCKESISHAIIMNEALTAQKQSDELMLGKLTRTNLELLKKQEDLSNRFLVLFDLNECSKKNLEQLLQEKKARETNFHCIDAIIQKVKAKNAKTEETVLSTLRERFFSCSMVLHLSKDIKDTITAIKECDDQNAELMTNYSDFVSLLENEKNILKNTVERLELIRKDVQNKHNEIVAVESQLKRIESTKEQSIAVLRKREAFLAELEEKEHDLTDTENQIMSLSKENADLVMKNHEFKKQWLRKQSRVAKLIQQKSKHTRDADIAKKYLLMLDYKKFKLNQAIEKYQREEDIIFYSMTLALARVSQLNQQLCESKKYGNVLDNKNYAIYDACTRELEDLQREMSQLVCEIEELESQKEELRDELLSIEQEDIIWERKIKTAIEMKQDIMAEQSIGDIGNMKVEIHHMEIRHSQLKKAQEKLTSDLELCVLRTENALNDVVSGQKKVNNIRYARQAFLRKLKSAKENLLQLKIKTKDFEKEHVTIEQEVSQAQQYLKNIIIEKNSCQEAIQNFEEKIETLVSRKYKNLEILTYKQRKIESLFKAKGGNYIILFRSAGALESEYLKQSCLTNDLISVTETLRDDFPSYSDVFSRILHLLYSIIS